MLFVPNLDCNLHSVSKLTQDLNCLTSFSAKSCVFQDAASAKMIGSVEMRAGLYILKIEDPLRNKASSLDSPSPIALSLSFSNSVITLKFYFQSG